MITYSIGLSDLLHFNQFRLQVDKRTWRRASKGDAANDFLTNDYKEVISLQKVNEPVIIDGQSWVINKQSSSLIDDDGLFYRFFVERTETPVLPSKEQLADVISKGDNNISNSLILNVDSRFELRDKKQFFNKVKDPSIVFRHETFSALTGHVGRESANDMKFVDKLYAKSLHYWKLHLMTGKTGYHDDYDGPIESIETLIKEISAL